MSGPPPGFKYVPKPLWKKGSFWKSLLTGALLLALFLFLLLYPWSVGKEEMGDDYQDAGDFGEAWRIGFVDIIVGGIKKTFVTLWEVIKGLFSGLS